MILEKLNLDQPAAGPRPFRSKPDVDRVTGVETHVTAFTSPNNNFDIQTNNSGDRALSSVNSRRQAADRCIIIIFKP